MKKGIKTLALVLASGALLMTSCGGKEKIYPSLNHKDIEIVDPTGSFDKETLDILYEMIHDGSATGSDVRDVIIESIAKNVLGEFEIDGEKIILKGYTGADEAAQLTFVQLHNAYWDTVDGVPTKPTTLTDSIKNRVDVVTSLVHDNVINKLFDEANTDTYKEHNYFKEYKFARDKIKTSKVGNAEIEFVYDEKDTGEGKRFIYDSDLEKEDGDGVFHNNILVDENITKENPESIVNPTTGILHLDYYKDYINREIMPSIINTLLVEQYIFENQYAALSRSQSRKVNYIEIQATKDTYTSARLLAKKFINDYIAEPNALNAKTDVDFSPLANAWKGVGLSEGSKAYDLITSDAVKAYFPEVTSHQEALGGKKLEAEEVSKTSYIDGKEHNYFKNTQYGKLIEDFAKINTNIHDTDSNAKHSEFTNSGAYTVEKGLDYKTKDIQVKDYTTDTWGTKDNGFASLPASIKTPLFDYSVGADTPVDQSNFVDSPASKVKLVNGHYFLKATDTQTEDPADTLLHRDDSTSTIYIVEIEHALTQAKLDINSSGTDSYAANDKEKISRSIGYTMASTDTYKNTAYLHYLENCEIKYHDQSIYDFMKSNYKDLFEK